MHAFKSIIGLIQGVFEQVPTFFGTSESPRLDRRVVVVNLARCHGNHPHWCGSPAFRSWPGFSFEAVFVRGVSRIANRNHLSVGHVSSLVTSKFFWGQNDVLTAIWLYKPSPGFFFEKRGLQFGFRFPSHKTSPCRPRSLSNATSQMSTPGLEAEWLEVWDHVRHVRHVHQVGGP